MGRNMGVVYRGATWAEVFQQVEAHNAWRYSDDREEIAKLADIDLEVEQEEEAVNA